MNRPRGITVLAYVGLVGSGMVCLIALALGLVGAPDGEYPWWLLFVAGVLGLATAVGLLKLKKWARILTMVGAMMNFINTTMDMVDSLRGSDASLFDAAFSLGLMALNFWILLYLDRPHVKEAFGVKLKV